MPKEILRRWEEKVDDELSDLPDSEKLIFLLNLLLQYRYRLEELRSDPNLTGATKERIDMKVRQTDEGIVEAKRKLGMKTPFM